MVFSVERAPNHSQLRQLVPVFPEVFDLLVARISPLAYENRLLAKRNNHFTIRKIFFFLGNTISLALYRLDRQTTTVTRFIISGEIGFSLVLVGIVSGGWTIGAAGAGVCSVSGWIIVWCIALG